MSNIEETIDFEHFEKKIYDNFFHKKNSKTSHETLYTDNSILRSGYIKSEAEEGYYTHINYNTMKKALELLYNNKKNNFFIVETGCSTTHGTKSTLLWDSYSSMFGGNVISVDLNTNAVNIANAQTSNNTSVINSDSLEFLPTIKNNIDFLYLDSYDLDFKNPIPSAEHHLKEFNCIKHLLHKGSIILIDDTPLNKNWLDDAEYNNLYHYFSNDNILIGKGTYVNQELEKMGAKLIMHQYQSLWQII